MIRIDPASDGLSVTVHGDAPVTTSGLVMPIARALMDGHGRIDVSPGDDRHSGRIVVTFDQPARP